MTRIVHNTHSSWRSNMRIKVCTSYVFIIIIIFFLTLRVLNLTYGAADVRAAPWNIFMKIHLEKVIIKNYYSKDKYSNDYRGTL